MKIQMTRVKTALFILAIMLTNVPIMADAVIIPISNNLYEVFPEYVGAVNFIVSGPQLIVAIASLIAAPLMLRVSKKKILVGSGILCAAGLCLGVAVENVWFVLICRVAAGFATGFINVAAVALITEIYTDETKRGNMMGIYNAVMAGIGTLMGIAAGYLAVGGWTNAYKVFWVCVPMVVCFVLFLPDLGVERETSGEAEKTEEKKGFSLPFWLTIINLFLFYIANMGITYFVSVYVAENGLGNEAFAGTAASLTTAGSFVCCLAFGWLYSRGKRYVIFGSYIAFLAAAALLIFAPAKGTCMLAMILLGGSYGFAFSYSYAHTPTLVRPSQTDTAISVATFVYAIGAFAATYLVTFLMDLTGNSFTGILPYMLGIGAVVLVIEMISVMVGKKQTV